jgi:drug/metabolite transporter (DMT)-like permease
MNLNANVTSVRYRQVQEDALLLFVALIWGSTFVLVKQPDAKFPVFAFLCIRFLLATCALHLVFGRQLVWQTGHSITFGCTASPPPSLSLPGCLDTLSPLGASPHLHWPVAAGS